MRSISASTSPFPPVRGQTRTDAQSKYYKTWRTFGIGAPLVFGRLGVRLAAQDALGNLQHAISSLHDQFWPGADYRPRASSDEDGVRTWFENASGQVIRGATIPFSVASRRAPHRATK
jgi:hypothetical protein